MPVTKIKKCCQSCIPGLESDRVRDFERVRFVIHLSRHIGNGEDFQAMVGKISNPFKSFNL